MLNKLLISKMFLAEPTDEVHLQNKVNSILLSKEYSDINQIHQEHGVDISTRALFQKIVSSKHSGFIKEINQQILRNRTDYKTHNIKCLIIPGMFYKEHPEAGSDGALIESICKINNIDTEIICTNSKGSITENKEIIRNSIQQQKDKDIWLFSISKGTADLRACLEEFTEIPLNIKGWISFSGIFSGATLAAYRTKSLSRRVLLRLVCKLTSVDYKLIEELHPKHAYWKNSKKSFKEINLIHVIGFPLLSHVQPLIAHRFKELSESGPTDGMIDLKETLNYPGHLYPIWGCDHFLRNQNTSELLYKLCHYIKSKPSQGT